MELTNFLIVCLCVCLLAVTVAMTAMVCLLLRLCPSKKQAAKERREYIQARETALAERMQAGTVGNRQEG